MNKEFTLKMLVQAVDQVTRPARKMGQALGDMARRARLDRLAAKLAAARAQLAQLSEAAGRAGKRLREIGGAALTRLTAPIALIGGFALNASGKMEQLQVAFESMLGSADGAKRMVKSLADFAAGTPFQLEGIGAAAKQLLSFGVAEEDVMGRLKILGDIAAGANVPLQDMAAIFGKAKAKGKAMTEELLQLSDRGVPIIDTLAKQLDVPKEAIFVLASKGKISFDLLAKAMESMTQKGGIFADQMKKQSGTLFGLFSTLKDNVFNALSTIGDQLVDTFELKENMTELIGFIQDLVTGFQAFAKEHPQLTKIIFILGAVAAAAGPVLIALGLMASGFGVLASGASLFAGAVSWVLGALVGLVPAVKAVALAMMGPWGIAIAAVAAGAYLIYRNWGAITGFFEDLWSGVKEAFDKGFVNGVLKVLETFNPALWIAKGINALVKYLFDIDLEQIGRDWIGGLADGMRTAWQGLVTWLSQAITGLLDWMPDWVKTRLGIEGGNIGPLSTAASPAPAVRPAIGPAAQARVGGEVKVSFDNAPANMRVRKVTSESADVPIDVTAGFAMNNGW